MVFLARKSSAHNYGGVISGIIAIVATSATIRDNLYRVFKKYREAPDNFLELSNEVTDSRLIVDKLKDTVETLPLTLTGKDGKRDLRKLLD
jgi:hypothetical protein